MQDSHLTSAYEGLTQPLRNLTKNNARFTWFPECEQAYHDIVTTKTSDTALRPFHHELKTIHVAEAGPEGIASGVFQEKGKGCWVPVDQASRALTPCEKNYSETEKQSLGIPFDSYKDHQHFIPIYSGNKTGNARVERHRLKVQGFQYTVK